MRVAITLAYNGTHFLGSQIQKETNNTIFGQFEKVLSKININYRVVASGRTDKGVHASGQVCHIDIPEFWSDLTKFQKVLNEMLPPAIQVKNIKEVSEDFHARYSAKKRVYRYIIKEAPSNPFEAEFVTFLKELDFDDLQEKIGLFKGEHDFANFMKTGSDVKSSVRVIYRAFAYRHRGLVVLHFEGNGFLRAQIRLMVGALLQLGQKELKEALNVVKAHKIRPAPSNGLYLAKIKY